MRRLLSAILCVSVGVNVVLWIHASWLVADAPPQAFVDLMDEAPSKATIAIGSDRLVTVVPSDAKPLETWADIVSDDIGVIVERFRAAGFPEDVVQRTGTALVKERFAARRAEILGRAEREGRTLSMAESADLRAVRAEEWLLVARALGGRVPDQRARYLLAVYGDAIRSRLAGLGLTDAELGAIIAMQLDFDDRFVPATFGQPREMEAARKAEAAAVREPIDAILGPERAHRLRQLHDGGYGIARRVAEHLHLPPERADAVLTAEDVVRESLKRYRVEFAHEPARMEAALKQLGRSYRAALDAALTPEGAAAFNDASGWASTLDAGRAPWFP